MGNRVEGRHTPSMRDQITRPSGVSGHARPPNRVGSSVHFPRVSMLPWVRQRAAPVPLGAAAAAILPMYFV